MGDCKVAHIKSIQVILWSLDMTRDPKLMYVFFCIDQIKFGQISYLQIIIH